MSTDAVVFDGVRKTYGRVVAVERVSFSVPRGSFVGLIGHNGAGKSTCLKMLVGLVTPTEGRVLVDGVDVVADPAAARTRIGAVPEEPALYEWLTAREFLEFVAAVRGSGDVGQGLEIAALGADADRPIREYSQGMRRRTALAAAMLGDPAVLVLDEALNGLDPPSAAAVKHRLRARVDAGGTVLLSTHVVETVEAVADRVILMAHGRVVAEERVADLPPGGLERMFLERLEAARQGG
ncbi:MAG: ABC transporter ATP-binding protein [Alphaproteobacteria bacterium]|nr:ABC transporter ATP-binding protein [Alphaproteobacteria bacterium]MCB9696373.1 ABC transporter ATP-binding protein [Alphaproteobacteria bacterium]